jgi:hypothetical protein
MRGALAIKTWEHLVLKNLMKSLTILVLFTCLVFLQHNDYRGCDYIRSGYYELIYEADLAYLQGNRHSAYVKIKEAESKCALIEQPMYYEISKYVDLLVENNDFQKALQYIAILIKDYGYPLSRFEEQNYFPKLKENVDWSKEKSKLLDFQEEFNLRLNSHLVDLLDSMHIQDQKIRKEHPIPSNENIEQKIQRMQAYNRVDSVNEMLLKDIFEKQGYPNLKMLGFQNQRTVDKITTMLFHCNSDTAYFKTKLLEFIKRGECYPDVLGCFVDSYARSDTAQLKFIYGIYQNTIDKVKDVQNVDKRRMAIGMPTLEMKQKRDSILSAKYDFIWQK